jgi:hypothetical protein
MDSIKEKISFYGNVKGSDTRIKPWDLWKRVIIDKIRGNDSSYPLIRNYNFYTNGSAIMSGKNRISYIYTIDGYPASVPIDYRERIRVLARGAKVAFISTFEPTVIDWNGAQMKSKLKTWKTMDEDADEVTSYNYVENVDSMDSIERRKASLIYLADADKRRSRSLFKYRTLMIIAGVRGESFDKAIDEINDYCKSTGIKVTRVESQVSDYLKAFSPFTMELGNNILKQVGSNTLTDEEIARFSSYSQGKIGKHGIIFGTDIFSGYNVYKILKKKDTDAENILVTAETGGGKSCLLKSIVVQIIALPEYNGTINDIEGFEYIPMGNFCANRDKVVILNMAEGQGCYYDPYEIVLTGNEDLDKNMFSLSKSFTNSIMCVCVGAKLLEENVWVQKIINNAIAKSYTDLGVVESNVSTWSRTSGKDLFYVYSKFKDLYTECLSLKNKDIDSLPLYDRYKMNPEYLDALDKVVANLSEYFEPLEHGGIRSDVFKKKVSLSDIATAKLVINSFGMAGKSADTIDKTQMALTQLSAANISYLRSIFSKAQGKFNFKVWEEFQRWGQFPGSATTIKTAITGGRKLGDINFIVTNNVKELLDDDRFAIFDNITSFLVGAISSADTRERICKQLSVPQLQGDLDSLVTKKGDSSSYEDVSADQQTMSIYDKAFLAQLDKSVTTILKMNLPKHIADSDIFKTGVNINE